MIIAIICLVVLSFFFSIGETTLSTVHRTKFQTEGEQGDKKAYRIARFLAHPSEAMTALLIGRTISMTLLTVLVAAVSYHAQWHLGLTLTIYAVFVILFAEVIPKSIAANFANRIMRMIFPVVRVFVTILRPITLLLDAITKGLNRLIANGSEPEAQWSKAEIQMMFAVAQRDGALNEIESERLKGVMAFSNLKIKDVNTTPRVNVTAFSNITPYDEVYQTVMNEPYTRYPVYDEDIDHIIGVFHSKYLLSWSKDPSHTIDEYIAEPLFVNEHNRAEWVLRKMTISRKHLAIVLDEYGGTDGIVSHEDLIEEMLGMDIEDEMDKEEEEKLQQQRLKHQHLHQQFQRRR
ncbi:MAG: CNNM domain-containing protein [Staphylococcus lugdunensis]|nr:CNNM domain-containing protein [Staphylococcus lugdunensis]